MIEIAKKAAKEGGKIVMKHFKKGIKYEKKPDDSLVSVADKETEEVIKKIILSEYPNHAIKGEETGKSGDGDIIWHLDPIDGTSNFVNQIPYFCVSIAVEKAGKFVIGVVYDPIKDELFYAEEGKGAFLNGEKISVSEECIKYGCHIVHVSFRKNSPEKKHTIFKEMAKITSRFRNFGACALELTEIARGRIVSFITDSTNTYDFAGGAVIVKEAGGIATDCFGNELNGKSTSIIAANNSKNHKKIILVTKKFFEEL